MPISLAKIEKMKYQTNTSASLLTFLSLACSVIALFMLINYDNFGSGGSSIRTIPDHRIGIEIAIGIVTMLLTFLAAEKVKVYDKVWSFFGLFVLAAVNVARIFHLPVYTLGLGWIPSSVFQTTVFLFALSAALLIAAGVLSTVKVVLLNRLAKGGN
jgi:hypothetical protein